jgi:2-aminoadipate transaminase
MSRHIPSTPQPLFISTTSLDHNERRQNEIRHSVFRNNRMAEVRVRTIISGGPSGQGAAGKAGDRSHVIESRLARRAASLSTAFPAPHFPSELGPDVIPFDSGFASPQLLPDLTQYALTALTAHRQETLQYSPTQGQIELRTWLAEQMNADGCALGPENILVTNGAKHALELVCRLLLDEGDAIVVTAPTYFTAIPIFRSFGVTLLEVEQDEGGLRLDALARLLDERRQAGLAAPKLIYNVTDFHNPTGTTMDEARRRALIDLAAAQDIALVEDTPYRRVRFEGDQAPMLKALDRTGAVFHLGTFSKLVAPGLRIGWVAAEAEMIARLIQLKSDGGSSPFVQRMLYEFGSSGDFEIHVARAQRVYRERRDRIVAAVRRELPDARISVPEGGYYVWLTFPPHVDGDAFAARAAAAGVNLIAGSKFFAGGASYPSNRAVPRNHVRLSFSYATPDQIDEGLRRLAKVYEPVTC